MKFAEVVHIYNIHGRAAISILYTKNIPSVSRERSTQIESKLREVRAGSALEYIQPLDELKVREMVIKQITII